MEQSAIRVTRGRRSRRPEPSRAGIARDVLAPLPIWVAAPLTLQPTAASACRLGRRSSNRPGRAVRARDAGLRHPQRVGATRKSRSRAGRGHHRPHALLACCRVRATRQRRRRPVSRRTPGCLPTARRDDRHGLPGRAENGGHGDYPLCQWYQPFCRADGCHRPGSRCARRGPACHGEPAPGMFAPRREPSLVQRWLCRGRKRAIGGWSMAATVGNRSGRRARGIARRTERS